MRYLIRKLFTPLCFLLLMAAAWVYSVNEYNVGYLQGVVDHEASIERPHPMPPVVMPWQEPISQEEQAHMVRAAWIEARQNLEDGTAKKVKLLKVTP